MSVQRIQIDEDTWIFDEMGVRFFLLKGKERALLIDSGMMTRNAKELAGEMTDLPVSLLNTHADMDHVGSNGEFDEFYMHPAEASNYYKHFNGKGRMLPVWDGNRIDLGERILTIIETPGHTPGSIAILDEDRRRIFTGDPVQDGRIYMFGIQREMHAYRLSLLRLQSFAECFDEIYPSHGSCPLPTDMIMKLYEDAGKVMEGIIPGIEEELHGSKITAYDTGNAVFLCDRDIKN